MVRVLVAFLIEVGKGKREPEEIPKLLEAKDRKQIPFTAPRKGCTWNAYTSHWMNSLRHMNFNKKFK